MGGLLGIAPALCSLRAGAVSIPLLRVTSLTPDLYSIRLRLPFRALAPLSPSQPVAARDAVRYAIALAAPFAALLAQYLLSHWLGQHMPMLLFTLAVSAVAFQAGLGPGLLSTGVCTALAMIAWWWPG